jgi:membrane-associated phospholipid phosphatase
MNIPDFFNRARGFNAFTFSSHMKPLPAANQTAGLPEGSPPGDGWLHLLGRRLCTRWPAKMLGTILFMAAFFAVYFRLLNHPLFPVTTIPRIAVDRLIGFRPEALPLYLSLWIYVSLAPAFLQDRREIASYVVAVSMLGLLGFGFFLFWPTAVPKAEIDWSQHPAFAFLKTVDASGNACPSLHAAFAVFTALWFGRLLRGVGAGRLVRGLNWLWCLGILYSTVAIRQHVVLDILAGAALGAIVAAPACAFSRAPARAG